MASGAPPGQVTAQSWWDDVTGWVKGAVNDVGNWVKDNPWVVNAAVGLISALSEGGPQRGQQQGLVQPIYATTGSSQVGGGWNTLGQFVQRAGSGQISQRDLQTAKMAIQQMASGAPPDQVTAQSWWDDVTGWVKGAVNDVGNWVKDNPWAVNVAKDIFNALSEGGSQRAQQQGGLVSWPGIPQQQQQGGQTYGFPGAPQQKPPWLQQLQ